jgi:hypothetical protein
MIERGLRRTRLLLCAALALGLWTPAATAAPQGAQQRYVTVLDEDGWPVYGLAASDFELRDGAVKQLVLDAEPAGNPLAVAVVVAGFDAGTAPDLARATASISRKLADAAPDSAVSLISADGSFEAVVPGAPGLAADIGKLSGPATKLAGLITDACAALQAAPTDRRAIIALAKRAPGDAPNREPRAVLDALAGARAELWPIEWTGSSAGAASLDALLTSATQMSGSVRQPVTTVDAMSTAALRAATLLASQYVLTYAWPNPMLSQLKVTTRHDRGAVLMPAWAR